MKPTIDQTLLDQLPIGGPIFDFTFSDKIEDNTGIFHVCYTMEDNTLECAMDWDLTAFFNNSILN